MTILFLKLSRILQLSLANAFFLALGIVVRVFFFTAEKEMVRSIAEFTRTWANALCRILGIRVTMTGHFDEKKTGCIVSNHISYLDILVIGSISPSVFVAKHEVQRWPVIGWLARLAGTVFVDRGSKRSAPKSFGEIARILECGVNIVFFPEGTTTDGSFVREFRSTFFHVPASLNVPVIPVSIMYTHLNGRKIVEPHQRDAVSWYGDMCLLPHFWAILGLRHIDVTLHFNPAINGVCGASGERKTRKALSDETYESIRTGCVL
jgi:lyso-ornithine lipid O-acyltransferase